MIEIYRVGVSPALLSHGEVITEADIEANATLLMVYVDYEKGSESGLELLASIELERIGEFTITDSSYQNPIPTIATLGKYRIPIPIAKNEDRVKLKVRFLGDTSNPGSAKVYVEVIR